VYNKFFVTIIFQIFVICNSFIVHIAIGWSNSCIILDHIISWIRFQLTIHHWQLWNSKISFEHLHSSRIIFLFEQMCSVSYQIGLCSVILFNFGLDIFLKFRFDFSFCIRQTIQFISFKEVFVRLHNSFTFYIGIKLLSEHLFFQLSFVLFVPDSTRHMPGQSLIFGYTISKRWFYVFAGTLKVGHFHQSLIFGLAYIFLLSVSACNTYSQNNG